MIFYVKTGPAIYTIIANRPDLKITNLEQLPRGTGAPYLEVLESHRPDELIAVRWRRKPPSLKSMPQGHFLVAFGANS